MWSKHVQFGGDVTSSGRPSLIFNGIDETTSEYDLPPLTVTQLAAHLRARFNARSFRRLKLEARRQPAEILSSKGEPASWVDPMDLASAGWSVLFAPGCEKVAQEALRPLLKLRQEQAMNFYRQYEAEQSYQAGDSKRTWLRRQKVGPGPADPAKNRVPYYILIVGDPEAIPFDFQFDLATQYAVGRLHFESLAEYANYARTVVEAESRSARLARKLAVFGVENADDPATRYSMRYLVRPLVRNLVANPSGWSIDPFLRANATKSRLAQLFGQARPALLFAACHGLGPSKVTPDRLGALLCQDWPGPGANKRSTARGQKTLHKRYYFAAEDLSLDTDLRGMVAFLFACFSAGAPKEDSFAHEKPGEPRQLGASARLAPLACRLLGKRCGAAAAIGHVDRARGFSFVWPGAGSQPQTIESVVRELMAGARVGHSARFLANRSAEIHVDLNSLLLKMLQGERVEDQELVDLWTANVDARSYLVLGDPAARLQV